MLDLPWYAALPQIILAIVIVALFVAVLVFAGIGVVHVLHCP